MTSGQLIKAARKKAKMTQEELGSKMGVTSYCINKWETGVRNPKYSTLSRIADALGVSVNCLLLTNEWISVKERLPEVGVSVLALDKWGNIHNRYMYRCGDGGAVWTAEHLVSSRDVTHWMPLPEPPKEG